MASSQQHNNPHQQPEEQLVKVEASISIEPVTKQSATTDPTLDVKPTALEQESFTHSVANPASSVGATENHHPTTTAAAAPAPVDEALPSTQHIPAHNTSTTEEQPTNSIPASTDEASKPPTTHPATEANDPEDVANVLASLPVQSVPVDPQNAAGDALTGNITIDSNTDDSDSAFGDDASSLASLESWVQRYRMENGRRFHSFKDGAYLLPNDEAELDRLDLHHHVFSLILRNKLYLAPLQNPQRVLDIGTGTGIWAIDFADEFPNAQVIGIDLSPVQPAWVPSNIEFQIDDIEDEWTYHQKFDYIHIRSMAGSIGDWRKLLRQAYDNLNPGGYIEVQEFEVWIRSDDDSLERAPMIRMWQEGLASAAEMIQKSMLVAPHIKPWMAETGFQDADETILKIPQGPWAKNAELKRIGLCHREQMKEAANSYGLAHFTRVLGWKPEEYNILATKVRNEMMDRELHLFSYFHDIVARKPGGPSYGHDGAY